ncbi:MAG: CRISPR-associated protein Cas4 [Candidatus Brockarchaeota archaeon]|nr:CRISPR-associated protein Cas4 [Candidatus Brockarchaeota archaeon]
MYSPAQKLVPTIQTKCFRVGDELRRELLKIRDEAFEIVANARDLGRPAVCPDYFPYYPVCTGQFKRLGSRLMFQV